MSPLRPLLLVTPLVLACFLPVACGGADSASGPGGGEGGEGNECTRVVPNAASEIPEPPDGATLCAPGSCNLQTQEGCGDDEACRPQYPAGSTSVAPGCEAAGDAAPGEPCSSSADCARGALCIIESPDAPEEGTCRTQCCGGDWSACGDGESCIRQFVVRFADGHTEHAVDFCVPVGTCDVFDPESCADQPGRECKVVDPTGAVACAPASDRFEGDSCAPPDVCAQGLSCVDGQCVRLCRAEVCGEPGCADGDSCVHFSRNPPGVGECTAR